MNGIKPTKKEYEEGWKSRDREAIYRDFLDG
jgi:hypothetical protein